MTVTVRELIHEMQVELREAEELHPGRAAELLQRLTSLLGNVNEEVRNADFEYANVLLECLQSDEKANRAKIRAETTPAYLRKREARDVKELTIETIRFLKSFLRLKEEEMRLTR